MLLLGLQLGIQVLVLSKVAPQPGDLGMSRVQDILLGVELGIEVGVLLLSVDKKTLLIIDFLSKC